MQSDEFDDVVTLALHRVHRVRREHEPRLEIEPLRSRDRVAGNRDPC